MPSSIRNRPSSRRPADLRMPLALPSSTGVDAPRSTSTLASTDSSLDKDPPLERDDLELLSHLVPDLETALRVQQIVDELRARAAHAERTLDVVPFAILLVDAQAIIVRANRAATRLLDGENGLKSIGGRLCGERATVTDLLQSAVVSTALHGQDRGPCALSLLRDASRWPLRVTLTSLPRPASNHTDSSLANRDMPLVLVTADEPAHSHRPDAAVLQQQFDLTPAQARLAVALAAGESLEDYAQRAGLSVNTTRSTLKSVFARTGCRRQAELVLVLTGCIAPPRRPNATATPDSIRTTRD